MVTTVLLSLAFLFFVGSCIGWGLEVLFRRFFSAKKWINPGFLTGPYLPLYGFGLVGLYLVCLIPVNTGKYWLDCVIIVLIMGASMTLIEYLAGIIFIKGMKIKLWDYSDRKGNIQGIICPLFSLIWTAVGALYLFVVDPFVISWVEWFVSHIAFAFVVGLFFGVFAVDLAHSVGLSVKIRTFAKKNGVIIVYEKLKESVKERIEKFRNGVSERAEKFKERKNGEGKTARSSFIFPFRSHKTIEEQLEDYMEDSRLTAEEDGDGKK